jgi:hypothetical protein
MEPSWHHHCAHHAALAVPGRDIWQELGGCPHSPREAAALYRRLGVRVLREAVGKVLGPEIDTAFAMRGDIVMAQNALGICRGDLAEFMDRMMPMKQMECAWRAGGALSG